MPTGDVVWIDVLPSMRQFGRRLADGVGSSSRDAGRQAGEDFGASYERAAADRVAQASGKMSAALRSVQDATGKLAVAEAKLTELQAAGNASASRLAAATEAVARARRQETAANEALNASTARLTQAQEEQTRAHTEGSIQQRRSAKDLLSLRLESDALNKTTRTVTSAIGLLGSVSKAAFGALGTQALVGGLVAVVGAAGGAAGAIGLVPAAAALAAAPVLALKLGLTGVGDAFKALASGDPEKFNEALAKLSPLAREFVLEAQKIKPAFDAMRMDVQNQLFEGLAAHLRDLSGQYLPLASKYLGFFAADLNYAAQRVAYFFEMPATANDLTTILGNAREAFGELVRAARPAVEIITDVGVVGSTFLPGLAGGFGDAAANAAIFVQNARDTGRLQEWISGGLSVLGQLGQVLGNVGSIMYSVFSAGAAVGGGFIETLRVATGEVAKFLASPVGQSMLATFFESVGGAVKALAPLLSIVGQIVLGTVAPALADLATQLAPIAGELLTAMLDAFQRLAPVMPQVGDAIIAIVEAFIPWISPLTDVALTLLPPFLAGVEAMAPVAAPAAGAVGLLSAGLDVMSSVTAGVTAITEGWATVQTIASGAAKVWTGVQWLLNASLLGFPVVWLVAALAAVVVGLTLLWKNSETFRDIVKGVWQSVQDAISWAWTNVIQPAFAAIGEGWRLLVQGISDLWTGILRPAWDAVAAAGVWLWNEVLRPAFDGIVAGWSALVTAIKWAWDNVLNPTWEVLKAAAQVLLAILVVAIFGPIVLAWEALSAAFKWSYENVIQPMWNTMKENARILWEVALKPLWDAMKLAWNALGTAWRWVYDNVIQPMWNALQIAAGYLWDKVLSPYFDKIKAGWEVLGKAFQTVYDTIVKPAFDAVSTAAGRLKDGLQVVWDLMGGAASAIWTTIKSHFVTGINAVIGLVNKFLDLANTVAGKVGINLGLHIDPIPVTTPSTVRTGAGNTGGGGRNTRLAAGGKVPGYSPNDKADNIPAMLTAREWVHPVAAVDYYGENFMRAIQTRAIPRDALAHYATGGQIFDFMRQQFPRAKLNSSYRPGDPGYHGRNQAADLGEAGFSGGTGRPYIAAMKQWAVDNLGRANEIIYTGSGNNRPNIKNGAPHNYSASVNAGHLNHLHLAIAGAISAARGGPGGAPTGGSGGGGIVGFVREILGDVAQKVADPVKSAISSLTGGNVMMQMVGGVANKVIQGIVDTIRTKDDAQAAAAGATSATPPGAGVERWRGTVLQALTRVGQPGSLADTTLRRMNQESGGNPRAINGWDVNAKRGTPSKGLMQVIDPTFATHRDRGLSGDIYDPLANIVASMRYALKRYGSLSSAYNRPGGYALGGMVLPEFHQGGSTRRWSREHPAMLAPDERVFKPEQDQYFRRFVDATSGVGGQPGGGRKLAENINVYANDRDQGNDIVEKLWHKVRVADRGGVYTFTV